MFRLFVTIFVAWVVLMALFSKLPRRERNRASLAMTGLIGLGLIASASVPSA